MKETYHIPPPCQKQVEVLFADQHLLLVNKPEGLLSVPGKVVKDCLISRIICDYPSAAIVHRLDLDTSGLMVLALSKIALSALNKAFRDRTIKKEYIAIVDGLVADREGTIEFALSRDPENRPRQRVDEQFGKSAITRYQLISQNPEKNQSRLILRPETGRTHQLRIHLATEGHPILGCDLYAPADVLARSDRLLLHASRLEFQHPLSDETLSFDSSPEF